MCMIKDTYGLVDSRLCSGSTEMALGKPLLLSGTVKFALG